MSCFYVVLDFFNEDNARKAFEFCKENFEWFTEYDGDSAGFIISDTKIANADEGLDSDDFEALSEDSWLQELSENGFEFKAQIVNDGSDSYSGENDILECESKNNEFNSERCYFMYDNGCGFDIIEKSDCGLTPCKDIWSQEPVEMTLTFESKETGKKYNYAASECSIGADSFDEIMEGDYFIECGCFNLIPDGPGKWSIDDINIDDLHYSTDLVPIDGGETLNYDDDDDFDFYEEFDLVDVSW